MILSNNPRIDASEVEAHVARVLARRRSDAIPPAERAALPAPALRLSLRQRIRRVPVLGPVLAFLLARWRRATAAGAGPRERLKAVPLVGDLLNLLWSVGDLPRFRTVAALRLDAVAAAQAHDRAQIAALGQALAEQQRANGDLRQHFERELAALTARWKADAEAFQAASVRQDQALRALERRVALPLQPPGCTLPDAGASAGVRETAGAAAASDAFYLAFEERFRGAREVITERQRAYLPTVRAALAGIGAPLCVDIGCGRGEWLELLAEEGLPALGIDLNEAMVQACHERRLDVRLGDGLAWLRAQAAGSVHVVTAFQVIEHLPFAQMIELLDATLQALAPAGVAIFETPNPENLQVGACNFYYDPTHRHPIAPAVAAFLAEHRGFARVEIMRLNPYPEAMWLPGDDATTRRLNPLLYGPQDYALIVGRQHAR